MGVVREWNSGRGPGTHCAWTDNLGPDFKDAAKFAENPLMAEKLLATHLRRPVELNRIQEIQSPALGNICLFNFTPVSE
jgi:hypothetical protein